MVFFDGAFFEEAFFAEAFFATFRAVAFFAALRVAFFAALRVVFFAALPVALRTLVAMPCSPVDTWPVDITAGIQAG